MTKILPLMLVAASLIPSLGLVAQGTATARGESFPLDVMTFNIRTAMGRDGDNVWHNRRDLVAETIRRSGPHVVGLQEVLTEQIKFLELLFTALGVEVFPADRLSIVKVSIVKVKRLAVL